jgi:hypothetical protein
MTVKELMFLFEQIKDLAGNHTIKGDKGEINCIEFHSDFLILTTSELKIEEEEE